ncbi:ABC transporter substrate-binding protein [Methanoregula sp.]|uniref:ABC transporter substrate-binding protein n=1 Tax=Methanoregula sp. TaxID=2052170 RepID=UPI003C7272FD
MKKTGFPILFVALIFAIIVVFAINSNHTEAITQNLHVASTGLTRNVTNLDGTIFTVPANITRIGCLKGPSYEKVVILGAEDKVILTSDSNNLWPWANVIFRNLTNVSQIHNAQNPNIEDLLENKPDVIFFWTTPPEVINKIQDAGIAVAPVAMHTEFNDTKAELQVYADVLGPDAQAKSAEYSQYFDEKVAMVLSRTASIPQEQRPTVYFAVRTPLSTTGKEESDISDMISLAGGRSVTADLSGPWGFDISMEQLLQWDPDYIIIDHCGASNLGSKPAGQTLAEMVNDTRFNELKAMKNQHVYISPTGVFFWDAGSQQILQLMWLAKILHPEKFEDLDMHKEIKEFYTRFYNYNLTDEEADRILKLLPPAQPAGK